jgi:hypothetical protein
MSATGHKRRTLLAAGVGVITAPAGCGLADKNEPAPPPPAADPLRPALDETLALVATYDRVMLAQPGLAARLAPLAADHRAHVAELARTIGTGAPSAAGPPPSASAPTTAPSTAPAAALTELRAAELAAQRNADQACRRAPATRAALLGSIAACRATHAEALR